MIERAIVQEVIARDGSAFVRDCPRPDAVRAIAQRMIGWAKEPERCSECSRPAVAMRGSRAVCGVCRSDMTERRAAYDLARILPTVQRDANQRRELSGYPIVFNKLSVDLGGFREIIAPSAAERMMTERSDVRALVDHDSGRIIGRRSAGTLTLKVDRRGVYVEIDPPETSAGRDIYESVSRRDVTGGSFAFRVLTDDWRLEDGMPIRTVEDMTVSEVSPVSFPAYPDTQIHAADVAAKRARETWQRMRLAR